MRGPERGRQLALAVGPQALVVGKAVAPPIAAYNSSMPSGLGSANTAASATAAKALSSRSITPD
jgi:hypothetical protein